MAKASPNLVGGPLFEKTAAPAPQGSYERIALWACLLLAIITRVWLIAHTHGVIDGDEALVGIQAQHILRGELPVYFYGQPYLGSLEAYLIALLFAIAGPSVWTLRAEPILLSLLLVWLTWKLATALADIAHLPAYAKRTFVTVAALLAAIPPLYGAVAELRTWGGLIETFILMLLLLLSVLQVTQRWHAGASQRELLLRWAGIGFIVGLGFWIYPLIVSAVLAAAIWIVYDWIRSLDLHRQRLQGTQSPIYTNVRDHAPLLRTGVIDDAPSPSHNHPLTLVRMGNCKDALLLSMRVQNPIKYLLLALVAIPTSLIGFAPALLWGATHQWQNISYVLGLGSGTSTHRLATIRKVTQLYATCVAPRVISGAVPYESPMLAIVHSSLLIVGVLSILGTVTLLAASFVWPNQLLLRIRQLAALPTLFGGCTAFIFCISTVSASGLLSSCDADFVGRYATPLLLALPFFFATLFTIAITYLHDRSHQLTGILSRSVRSTRTHWGPVPSWFVGACRDPMYRARLRSYVGANGTGLAPTLGWGQIILFAFLLLYLGAQTWTYGLTDPNTTFQSPFCLAAPANNDPIIAYMQHEHIHYAWAANLLGYPLVFKTDDSIIIANPLAITTPPVAIDRIPAYTTAVQHADRPSILTFVQHNDAHPSLLMLLDEEQVTYRVARFPSEPGFDILVVTPLNRTVSPFTSKAFNGFFVCPK